MALEHVGPKGRVAGVDLAAIDPPFENENVFAIEGDIGEPSVQARLLEFLGGPADVLLSDAAPKLTGIRATDRAREEVLLEAIEAATPALLAVGGSCLVKLLDCPEAAAFHKRTRSQFDSVKVLKPEASRKGTTEKYLLAKGFRG